MIEFWQWINTNGIWLGTLSAVTFIGTLIAIPVLVASIPADYFIGRKRHLSRSRQLHPVLYLIIFIVKNLIGSVLILAGIAMLVLPGQGLLTILIGITLTNFPGKFTLERKLVFQHSVFSSINWIRERAGKEPLMRPEFDNKNGE